MDLDFEPTQEPAVDAPAGRVTRGAAKKNLNLPPVPAPAPVKKEPSKPVSGHPAAAPAPADPPAPVRSIRRMAKKSAPAEDELSEDEIEVAPKIEETKPAPKVTKKSADDPKPPHGKSDTVSTTKAKTESASKLTGGRKRSKLDDDEDEAMILDEDAPRSDHRPTKRLRATDTAPDEDAAPPAAPPRRVSAAVFGTVNPAPAKKRYGGKKGRASSPSTGATDTDMAVDYDELPAPARGSPSPPPPPVVEKAPVKAKAAKQEPGVGKSRVAAMKGKAGQKPAAKAPPKSKPASPEKKKSKTQSAAKDDMDVDGEVGYIFVRCSGVHCSRTAVGK
ncbi:hypothetical protein DFH07DRAFT_494243 [Mycena maculata]|uniref:Uncharacterized protein n=1 Tax=Mycena maculata TaxID=230809 RepID=A0AAD7J694_9AGAR|nr:hypothetical protein DFH07DRAFT_494243 [Mycena maculata]